MKRTPVNPVGWGEAWSMHQAEITESTTRTLRCSGQTALVEDPDAEFGLGVQGVGDIRTQIETSLSAVDDILHRAGMQRSNIVFVHFYTTEMEAFLANYDVYATWIGAAHIMPPQSLLGVAALALPDLMVEVEVTAAA